MNTNFVIQIRLWRESSWQILVFRACDFYAFVDAQNRTLNDAFLNYSTLETIKLKPMCGHCTKLLDIGQYIIAWEMNFYYCSKYILLPWIRIVLKNAELVLRQTWTRCTMHFGWRIACLNLAVRWTQLLCFDRSLLH